MEKEKFDKLNDFLYDLENNLKEHIKNLVKGDFYNYIEIQGCANGLVAVNKLICDLQDAEEDGRYVGLEELGELCHEDPLEWLLFDMFEEGCNLGHIKELMKSKLSTKVGKEIIEDLKSFYSK
jgi:hypothetical protein